MFWGAGRASVVGQRRRETSSEKKDVSVRSTSRRRPAIGRDAAPRDRGTPRRSIASGNDEETTRAKRDITTSVEDRTMETRILSIPFGPSVDLTRSLIAIAPTKEARRACSPFSSLAPSPRTFVPALLPIIDMTCEFYLLTRARREARRGVSEEDGDGVGSIDRGGREPRSSARAFETSDDEPIGGVRGALIASRSSVARRPRRDASDASDRRGGGETRRTFERAGARCVSVSRAARASCSTDILRKWLFPAQVTVTRPNFACLFLGAAPMKVVLSIFFALSRWHMKTFC